MLIWSPSHPALSFPLFLSANRFTHNYTDIPHSDSWFCSSVMAYFLSGHVISWQQRRLRRSTAGSLMLKGTVSPADARGHLCFLCLLRICQSVISWQRLWHVWVYTECVCVLFWCYSSCEEIAMITRSQEWISLMWAKNKSPICK